MGFGGDLVRFGSQGGSGSSGSSSGITTINPGSNTGPTVTFQGVNGIEITSPSTNIVLVDGSSISGVNTQFSASFISTTSGLFCHNLGTRDLLVQIYDDSQPPEQIFPDRVIYDTLDAISVLFNTPQTGRVTIIGSGVNCALSNDVAVNARRYSLLVS